MHHLSGHRGNKADAPHIGSQIIDLINAFGRLKAVFWFTEVQAEPLTIVFVLNIVIELYIYHPDEMLLPE